jgi:CubicO group peptidase (beta-lactamase class C family)
LAATPEDLGLSSQGLERARACVEGCVERGEIAGAVMLVSRHDQAVQLACVGMRDIEAGLPMTPDTIFRMASMTKPITSVGALMLVEAGKLRLDDPVSRYIPEFAGLEVFDRVEGDKVSLVALERPITVRHLLTHTSGMGGDPPHPALEGRYDNIGDARYSSSELMRRIAAQPLVHQPGEGWWYGWGHAVLGRVIEVVADQPLDEYLASAVFTPLGMVDTGFHVPPARADRLAAVYAPAAGLPVSVDDSDTSAVTERVPVFNGGSGMASTTLDYLRFARMLLRGGELDGVRLLQPAVVAEMTRNHLAPRLLPLSIDGYVLSGEGYGLGVGVIVEPSVARQAGSKGTYQWGGSWNTRFWIDPAKRLIGLFMVQSAAFTFEGIGTEYRSLVAEALMD